MPEDRTKANESKRDQTARGARCLSTSTGVRMQTSPFSREAGQITTWKGQHFFPLNTSNNCAKEEIGKTLPFTVSIND